MYLFLGFLTSISAKSSYMLSENFYHNPIWSSRSPRFWEIMTWIRWLYYHGMLTHMQLYIDMDTFIHFFIQFYILSFIWTCKSECQALFSHRIAVNCKFLKKNILPKISNLWLKFKFQLPKKLVLELTVEHFSSSEHIYWQLMCIFPSLHFSGQRLIHWVWCISVTFKSLRLSPNLKIDLKRHNPSFCPV